LPTALAQVSQVAQIKHNRTFQALLKLTARATSIKTASNPQPGTKAGN